MKKLIFVLFSLLIFAGIKADEGMWMLPLIEKLNIRTINGMGCTLSAEDIYSDKNVSLKDAVIIFGNGCTGVVVSDKGLVFTNHHCGLSSIQQVSSVEHNYLKDGFSAQSFDEEIPVPGLTVKFVIKIVDVTDKVISQLPDELKGKARKEKQDSILRTIREEEEKDTHHIVQVRPFYEGNEFYMFVFDEFTDVRLAFTPPYSIGKFGGETDNWMWPRHTGDFSVFRVYSDSTGNPAQYSKTNIPYIPKRYAAISNKGYKPGDYTMIMGFPGRTSRYLTSWGIENQMNSLNQARIDIRGAKQEVWKKFMKTDEAINIAYARKYASSSNYWKKSIGINNSIPKLKVIENKKTTETEFTEWVNLNPDRKKIYGNVLEDIQDAYTKITPYSQAINFLRESFMGGVEMPGIASRIERFTRSNYSVDTIINKSKEIYKDYYQIVDQATFPVMLSEYKKAVLPDALPEFYNFIDKKFKGDYKKYTDWLFKKSVFSSLEKFEKAIRSGKTDFKYDPAIIFWNDVIQTNREFTSGEYEEINSKIDDSERLYQKGLLEMYREKGIAVYPDANSTVRFTYGTVGGYKPADAVSYDYYTTTKGILEKEIPGDYEFNVLKELKDAINESNFGAYADLNTGEMHVAFLSNNDITGGNSGSPIFNAKGELIGLAFDGNWESLCSDIVFEPDMQRTINVDIRYVLFIMEKTGNAQRLINELKIQ